MLLGTVLIEPNRWRDWESPVVRLAEPFLTAIRDAGFDGLELWENHFHLADSGTIEALRASACPVRILNWYGVPGNAADESRLLRACEEFSTSLRGVKFNLSANPAARRNEEAAVERLADKLPVGVSLLCECHAATVLESPVEAGRTFDGWPESLGAILHPFAGNVDEWFDALGDRVRHLHLQLRHGGTWADPVPGHSAVDSGCEALKRRGFCGTATLEFIAAVSSVSTPRELLSAAAAVAALWTGQPSTSKLPWDRVARER